MKKDIFIISGGTTAPITPHFSICSEAYGTIGDKINERFKKDNIMASYNVYNIKTNMALCGKTQERNVKDKLKDLGWEGKIKTNDDVESVIDCLVASDDTRCIVMAAAMCDFKPMALLSNGLTKTSFGEHLPRLSSSSDINMSFTPSDKVIDKIRKTRKDIFLVSFKASSGINDRELYINALNNLKRSSSNLVFANDVKTKTNMIVTPEEFPYILKRECAIAKLSKMIKHRLKCTFTRSTVVEGDGVDWNGDEVPHSLRAVVNHCIAKGAYKPFRGATVGHFAYKGEDDFIYTSIRKSDFNDINEVGLVKVEAVGDHEVIAYGYKPSVGGQSQRIIFKEHTDVDCIVHFHCPMKESSEVPVVPQWKNECGSHECGRNTSNNMEEMLPGIKAVMLEGHGPNIIFNRNIDPRVVIGFIEENWILKEKTGGPIVLQDVG